MKENIYKHMNIAKDECYTTYNESFKLIDYLHKNEIIKDMKIWLPFDNEFSNIYKVLKSFGYETILSNLELNLDFYTFTPDDFDIIISNPPFSNRTQLMKRLLDINKPFIILQGMQYFNNQFAVNYLVDNSENFKLLLPRTRMSFLIYKPKINKIVGNKYGASFYSFWLCYKTKIKNTFTPLRDTGNEKVVEEYSVNGNVIVESHHSLFTYQR